MTRAPQHLTPDATVQDAQRLMRELAVTHLPVIADGVCRGIVLERDLKLARHLNVGPETEVRHLLVHDEFSVTPHESLASAVRAMASRAACSAVVMEGATVRGVLTTADVLRVLADRLEAEEAQHTRDGAATADDEASLIARAEAQAEQLLSGASDRSDEEVVSALRALVRDLYEAHTTRTDAEERQRVCSEEGAVNRGRSELTQRLNGEQTELLEGLLMELDDRTQSARELAHGVKRAAASLREELRRTA